MSLCDVCTRPGRCCSGFVLNASWANDVTALEALAGLASCDPLNRDDRAPAYGLPFLPLYKDPKGWWRFWCPNLGRDGRCGDYENRPQVCRDFVPESGDALCALNANAITREMTMLRLGGPRGPA